MINVAKTHDLIPLLTATQAKRLMNTYKKFILLMLREKDEDHEQLKSLTEAFNPNQKARIEGLLIKFEI